MEGAVTKEPAARRGAGIVEVDGAALRYRIEGDGPSCLVIGSSVYYPRTFSPKLREHLELAFVDLRHFAASDPTFTPEMVSIDSYADDIERVRETLGLEDVIVMGHSIHSCIALEYARRYPDHLLGVVAIGAAPYESDDEYDAAFDPLWEGATEERKRLRAKLKAELTPELRASLSPRDVYVREYLARGPLFWFDPTYDAAWLWEGVDINMPMIERIGSVMEPYYPGRGTPQISVPVQILHGRYDYANPYTLWDRHRHELPHHTFALFDRSGHTPQLEEPNRFDETLLAWLRGLA